MPWPSSATDSSVPVTAIHPAATAHPGNRGHHHQRWLPAAAGPGPSTTALPSARPGTDRSTASLDPGTDTDNADHGTCSASPGRPLEKYLPAITNQLRVGHLPERAKAPGLQLDHRRHLESMGSRRAATSVGRGSGSGHAGHLMSLLGRGPGRGGRAGRHGRRPAVARGRPRGPRQRRARAAGRDRRGSRGPDPAGRAPACPAAAPPVILYRRRPAAAAAPGGLPRCWRPRCGPSRRRPGWTAPTRGPSAPGYPAGPARVRRSRCRTSAAACAASPGSRSPAGTR